MAIQLVWDALALRRLLGKSCEVFIKKSEQMNLDSCSVVIWEVDIVGEDAMTVFINYEVYGLSCLRA